MRSPFETNYAKALSGVALFVLAATQVTSVNAAGTDGSSAIEEIVVTSQRRAERLQEVPISITAFSAHDIEQRGFQSALDLAGTTPNLQIKTSESYGKPTIFLRGMGFNDFNATAVGAVGVYNDEVYIGGSSNQLFQTFDLERIEVLRGPQGTLYGRNTTGGAINFISKKPTNELQASASLSYSRFNTVELEGAISGPLVKDKLTARLAGTFGRSDGAERNLFNNTDIGHYNKWATRLLMNFKPADNLEFDLNVHGGNISGDGRPLHSEGLMPGGVDLFGYKEGSDFYAGSWNLDQSNTVKTFGASVRAKVAFDGFDLVSISAYEQVKYHLYNDADAGPVDFIRLTHDDKQHQFSEELRLSSNNKGPLDWIVGGYFYSENLKSDSTYDIGEFLRDLGEVPDLSDKNAPLKIGQPYTQNTRSYAAFGQMSYAFTSQLKINLGLRFTHDKKSFDFRTFADEPSLGYAPLIDAFSTTRQWDALTGRAGIDYQVTPDAMIYVSYNRGYKSGGFNGGALFNAEETTPFNPERVNAYEAGFKTSWMDNRLILNGAVFYNKFSDLQVFRFITGGNGLPITLIANAASASIKGGELEAIFVPVEKLRFELGLGILDAKYDSFTTLASNPGGGYSTINLSGNQLVSAPKVTFSGAAEYGVNVTGDWTVTPRVEWSYMGKQYFDTSNDPLLSQDAYWLFNASLRLDSPSGNWGLSIWGKNIFGKEYNLDKVSLADFGINQVARGERATYGITLRAKY